MNKRLVIFVAMVLLLACSVSAFNFNGTVLDIDGVPIEDANVSVTVTQGMSTIAVNWSQTDATGSFSFDVTESASYFYEPSITHTNSTTNLVDYVGQSLSSFPHSEFTSMRGNITFYLREAGIINISAINSSGNMTCLGYQVKDTKLGYPIGTCTSNQANDNVVCNVPADRNYSIMIYPAQGCGANFIPVSFEWNNFSSVESYDLTNLTTYNATSKVLNKQFNVTESFARVKGKINATHLGINGNWTELSVVPFLLEPSDMIFMSYGTLPFDTSSWNGEDHIQNKVNGTFNITLPYASAETVRFLLFVAAKNGSTYYGSYRNITLTGNMTLNFTMYGLLGSDSMVNMSNGDDIYMANVSRQVFNIVNKSNNTLNPFNAHIEATVDYSDYDCMEFTFMEDISGVSTLSLPLLNVTGFKQMNIYSMSMAPKRLDSMTVAEIRANSNITMSSFNISEIDGDEMDVNSMNLSIFASNSTCDVPNPPAGCVRTSFVPSWANLAQNMLPIVMGGGKISVRMSFGGIAVHYVNVDMMASGPPDSSFDSEQTESTGDDFEAAMRFGSAGPSIYDYVLVSMPYTEGDHVVAGLNETKDVKINISVLYDEDWNVIWNTSVNGTNESYLANNYSHYSRKQDDWATLMNTTNCTTTAASLSASLPCYLDKDNDRVWIRLPYFSGTGPSVSGSGTATGGVSFNVTKTALNSTYNIGDTVEYTITIYNNGTTDITNVWMNDTYNGTYLKYSAATITNTSGDLNGTYTSAYWSNLTNGTSISPGETYTFYYNMTVLANKTFVNNTVTINCTDNSSATGIATAFIMVNTTQGEPSIDLNAPANNVNYSSGANASIGFNFTATDNTGISTCDLTINDVENRTLTTVTSGTSYKIYATGTFDDGLYLWNVTCNDTQGYSNTSLTRQFRVDTTAPVYDSSYYNTTYLSDTAPTAGDWIVISANWSDATTNISHVAFYFGGSVVNQTNATILATGSSTPVNLSWQIPISYNGTYEVYMSANDTVGNYNTTTRYNVTVTDNVAPMLTVSSPVKGYNSSSTTVSLTFTVTDYGSAYMNCSIDINGEQNSSYDATTGNTSTLANLAEGTYYYNLTCQDGNDNINTISNYWFTVDTTFPITGPNITNVTSDLSGNINLSWAVDGNADQYGLFRSTTAINNGSSVTAAQRIRNLTGVSTSYIDNSTMNGTVYWYALTTIDYAGNENLSVLNLSLGRNNITAVDSIAPRLPTAIKVTNSSNTATISWSKVSYDTSGQPDNNSLTYEIWVKKTTNINTSKNLTANGFTEITNTNVAHPTNTTTYTISSSGNYMFIVTTLDDGGNRNLTQNLSAYTSNFANITLTYTAPSTTTTTTSSSSGTSGGSVPATNIQAKRSQFWSQIVPGTPVELTIDESDIAVTSLKISVRDTANNVDLEVASLKDQPSSVSRSASSKVYQYLQITPGNLANSELQKATIKFSVSKTWLAENNVASENIVLFHYKDGAWKELPTSVSHSSSDKVFFTATTTSFSYFAIGEKKLTSEDTTPVEDTTPTEPTEEETEPLPIQPPTEEAGSKVWIAWLIAAIIVIAGVIVFVLLTKKE